MNKVHLAKKGKNDNGSEYLTPVCGKAPDVSYKPLSDHKLTQLAEVSNAATTHFERSLLIEQARRAKSDALLMAAAPQTFRSRGSGR